jgi:gliding motility-associated-like protein
MAGEGSVYSPDDVNGLSDDELYQKLYEYWGITDRKIDVWGELNINDLGTWAGLRNAKTLRGNQNIEYPLAFSHELQSGVFLSPSIAKALMGRDKKVVVACELTLASPTQRAKKNNPFLLAVDENTVERLTDLTSVIADSDRQDFVNDEDRILIRKVVYDTEVENVKARIDSETTFLNLSLAQKRQNIHESEKAHEHLTTKNEEILVGQDMVNNVVSFYVAPGDALAGINPIPIPTTYQNIANPQPIYVGITNTATSCYIGGVQFFNIEVREGAMATTPAAPYVLCDEVAPNDGFTAFDLGLQSLLDEILNGQDPLDYLLSFHETLENAMDGSNALGASYTNIINPQVIYGRVENAATECYEIVEVILKVEQLPVVTLPETYRLCVDAIGEPIAASEGEESPPVIDTGLDPTRYTFVWTIEGQEQEGDTGASIIALTGGIYVVTITQLDSGCTTTVSTTVTVSQAPVTWSFNLINGAFADSHTVEILAEGIGTYVYSIDGGPFQDSNLFDNVSPGVHTIRVKDANGCGEISFDIGVVDYPNYFTPNNDGYHDTWNIIGIAEFDPTAKIYIFDRYGKLLKQISPLTPGWDGTYNGSALPSSDYWFRVEYIEQEVRKEIKGHFTLKR